MLRVALHDILKDLALASPAPRKVHALSGCRGTHQDYHAYENGRVKQTYMDAAVRKAARRQDHQDQPLSSRPPEK